MKKTALHTALFALAFPMYLHAIGLGEMTIQSSLDQPFQAEVELIDVGSAPLLGIKVGVADPQYFQRIGFEPIAALSLLHFKIEKNSKGKVVIKIISKERMTEPYMELVVDLTWPDGQLYKAYTVLLDPPGYQLVSTRAQSSPTYYIKGSRHKAGSGKIDDNAMTSVERNPLKGNVTSGKKRTTFGPTITNENVWQIAQRYKTADEILPQIVLAIVGANPDAFKDGNLNGLKVGVKLIIPPTDDVLQVPAELATQEVMAHDTAWNEKKPINHVLTPPYQGGQIINHGPEFIPDSQSDGSQIPAIPKLTIKGLLPSQTALPQIMPTTSSVASVNPNSQQLQNGNSLNSVQASTIKAEISITSAAIESVRESNAILVEQLHLLQDQNKKLQSQLEKRDTEIKLIQSQMKVLMKKRLAVASQASKPVSSDSSSNLWQLLILLGLVAAGGGFAYWYFKLRNKDTQEDSYFSKAPEEPKPPVTQDQLTIKNNQDISEPVSSASSTDSNLTGVEKSLVQISKIQPDNNIIENNSEDNFQDTEPTPRAVKNKQPKKNSFVLDKDTDLLGNKQEMSIAGEDLQEPPVKEEPARPDMLVFEKIEQQQDSDKNEITSEKSELKSELQPEEVRDDESSKHDMLEFEQIREQHTSDDAISTVPVLDTHSEKVRDDEQSIKHDMLEFEQIVKQHTADDVIPTVPVLDKNDLASEQSESKSESQPEDKGDKEFQTHDILEFESGLHELIPEKTVSKAKKAKEEKNEEKGMEFEWSLSDALSKNMGEQPKEKHNSIDEKNNPNLDFENKEPDIDPEIANFFADQEDDKNEQSSINEPSIETSDESDTKNPLKSSVALDTLLALAKTYIGMDDIDSARFSLEEVLEYGNDAQKEEAQKLLDEIKDK